MSVMPPRKKSLLGASNPLLADAAFLPALSSNLAALAPNTPSHHPPPILTSFAMNPPSAPTPSAPVASSTSLVNKTGTQSLYQRCSYALARLLRIDGMPAFFSLSNSGRPTPRTGLAVQTSQDDDDEDGMRKPPRESVRARQSTDPVRQLWDMLALGVPLCILYNTQPGIEPLQIDTSCEEAERKLANNKVGPPSVRAYYADHLAARQTSDCVVRHGRQRPHQVGRVEVPVGDVHHLRAIRE
jgi:hypothetical protein